jgi:hypothetical protein
MSTKNSGSAGLVTPKNENGQTPQKFQRSSSSSTSGSTQYRTVEEDVFVPKLKFAEAPATVMSLLKLSIRLKLLSLVQLQESSSLYWPFQAMPSLSGADGDIIQLELDCIIEDYKNVRKIINAKMPK